MTVANVNVTKVLLKRGNTAQNNAYTGVNGEITIDTQAATLRIHDGSTVGGTLINAGGAVGSYSNTNTAAYLASQNITSANIGAYQTYSNANAAAQTTEINSLRANITAANAAIAALQSNAAVQAAVLDTLTGNAATQSQVLDTLTANAATQATTLTTLLSNAVAQQTSLIDLVANAAVQAQAIANVSGTYSNTNVKSYLGSFDGNILPSANVTYSLGSETRQWKDLWVSNNTIYIGNTPIRVDGGTLLVNNAPIAGTTANLVNGFYTVSLGATGELTLPGNGQITNNADDLRFFPNVAKLDTFVRASTDDTDHKILFVANGIIWSFNEDGTTSFPNGRLDVAQGTTFTIGTSTADTDDNEIQVNSKTIDIIASNINAYSWSELFLNNIDTSDPVAQIRVNATGGTEKVWTFDGNGRFTAPGDVYGQYFTLRGGNGPGAEIGSLGYGGNVVTVHGFEGFNVNTGDPEVGPQWQFDVGGNLVTPTGLSIGPIQAPVDGTDINQAPNEYLTMISTGLFGITSLGWAETPYSYSNVATIDFNGTTDGAVKITTGNNFAGSYSWRFDATGNLTLPANVASILYANGVSILDGISGTYGNTEVATYLNGGFNIDGPINFTASPPAYSSPGIQWPNGFQSMYFGNTEVAAYLPTYSGNLAAARAQVTNSIDFMYGGYPYMGWQLSGSDTLKLRTNIASGDYTNDAILVDRQSLEVNVVAQLTAGNVITNNGVYWTNGASILDGIASQSYVTTQINNLVNNAPALLDTLGEIAANLATGANVTGSILNSIASTNANVTAANVNITALQTNAASQQTSIDTLLSRVDQAVNTTSSPQFAGLTTTANVELTANVHIHQNLVVDGNINFIGNVTQTNITTANAVFTGDTYGFGALYAGVLGYTPLPYTVIQATADYNDYSQINFQNLNLSANASTEWVATAGNGSDLTNYIDFGIAGGAWNGTQLNSVGTAAKANDGWLYVLGNTAAGTGGNLVLGTIQPGRRVNILTGGPGSANIYSYFNASGLTTNNVRADNFVFSNSTNIFDSVESIVTTANSSMKSYVDSQIVASTGTGNVTFTDTTISTAGGAGQGIILNSAGSGEIAMLDYVGINNANPGYWLHVGDGSIGAVNNTGNISIDYNNGLDSSRAATILGYAWWDTGGNGNNNRGIGAHRQFGIYKNDDLYTTKYIEFDLNSGNANLTNIAVTRVTTTNGIFWANGVAFASSSYGNTEVAAYLPTASVITGIQANLGAFQTFSNTNAATQQTSINSINANLGAFQTYANTTFGGSSYGNAAVAAYLPTYTGNIAAGNVTVVSTVTAENIVTTGTYGNITGANVISANTFVFGANGVNILTAVAGGATDNELRANVGAYQIFANANAAAQSTSIDTINANIGSYQTYANANAATQATSIDTINANLGSFQTYANATFGAGSYANVNVQSYLAAFDGNILPSANVTYSLGSETHQWKDLWVSNNTIYIGNTPIRVDGGTLLVNNAPISGAYTNLIENGDSNVTIATPNGDITVSANNQIWTFDTNGTLTLPGDLALPGGLATVTTTNGGGDTEISTPGNITLHNSTGDWIFDSTGNLTLPGNIVASGTIIIDNRVSDTLSDIEIRADDDILIQAGDRTTPSIDEGGDINIFAGTGAPDDNTIGVGGGGDIQISAGRGGLGNLISGGPGGFVTIRSGTGGDGTANASGGFGNEINLFAGSGGADNGAGGGGGGDINISAGATTDVAQDRGSIILTSGDGGNETTIGGYVQIVIPQVGTHPGGSWTFSGSGTSFNVPANSEIFGVNYGNLTVGTWGNTIVRTLDAGLNTIDWTFDDTGNLKLPPNGNILYANGTNILSGIGGGTYGNTEVAAYLVANPQAGTYSNVNVEAYIGANIGAFQTYANATFGVSSYGNTEVAAYLTGNITAGNINATQYNFANGVNILSTVSAGSYANADAAAYLAANSALYFGNPVTRYPLQANNTQVFVGNATTIAQGGGSTLGSTYILNNAYYNTAGVLTNRNTSATGAGLFEIAGSTFNWNATGSATANAASGMGARMSLNSTALATQNSIGITSAGTLTVQGASGLVTSQTTGNLFNTTATTINLGGAATTINIGAATVAVSVGSGTGSITTGNVNVTNLYTANAVIAGGYISNTANIAVTSGGNISGVGNIIGATSNTTITAGSYTTSFLTNGTATIGGNVTASGIAPFYAPNRPAFRVYGTASTQILGGSTVSETHGAAIDYNQGSYYNNTTGLFTAPVAGLYHAYATLRVGTNNGLNQASIQKNSSSSGANVVAFWETDTNTGTATHFSMTGYANMVPGDTLRLQVITGNINLDSNDNWGVTYIG